MALGPPLVILAAGIGSRYGGDKHLASVGPGGETISDYLIYDALRAGFGAIVVVVREGMADRVASTVGTRVQGTTLRFVEQKLSDVPAGARINPARSKPWGTGQAVLAAARTVNGPFGVVNADDLYGREAFRALGAYLATSDAARDAALVGFPLGDTLSITGGVNRGVCRVDASGMLDRIREVTGIVGHDGGGAYRDDAGAVRVLPGDTPVSMNMWGFAPQVATGLETAFRDFLMANGENATAEFILPNVMESLVRGGTTRVHVLTGPFRWAGVTYPQDRDIVAGTIRRLIDQGVYPEHLSA